MTFQQSAIKTEKGYKKLKVGLLCFDIIWSDYEREYDLEQWPSEQAIEQIPEEKFVVSVQLPFLIY